MQYILLLILTSWVLTLATFLALKKILIQITATVSHFDENKSFNATSTSCIVQVFKVRGGKKRKKTAPCISSGMKLCGRQTNKAKQVQIKQSTLAPFINWASYSWTGLPSLTGFDGRGSVVQSDPIISADLTQIQCTWAGLKLPQRRSGEMCWYAGKTSSISGPSVQAERLSL